MHYQHNNLLDVSAFEMPIKSIKNPKILLPEVFISFAFKCDSSLSVARFCSVAARVASLVDQEPELVGALSIESCQITLLPDLVKCIIKLSQFEQVQYRRLGHLPYP